MTSQDSTRDLAEDFLYHLYRGSELLQDNRILEAKEALEQALTVQPLDAKGQDLLGTVYFRLGLYPRAIQIYEGLERQFSTDVAIKINLGLGYLKTGQPEPARRALRDAVELNPQHKRAWGYLGLALQKLGEFEQAQVAFERAGRPMMARRVTEFRRSLLPPPEPDSSSSAVTQVVREMAHEVFAELDGGDLRFALAESDARSAGSGAWHTLELGAAARPSRSGAALAPANEPARAGPDQGSGGPPWLLPMPGDAVPGDKGVELHSSGVLFVHTGEDPGQAFAGRLDALRVVAGKVTTRILNRRTRDGETSEVLGGIGAPLVRMAGPGRLVLGPRPGYRLAVLGVEEDLAFIREDLLLGFELRLAYENGRVAFDPSGESGTLAPPGAHGVRVTEGVPVVQLRGTGTFVVELSGTLAGLPSRHGQPLLVRREWIVGWLGRLVTRTLSPTESPNGHRGLIAFSGEGTVLVCVG
jgi:hypothetical protein